VTRPLDTVLADYRSDADALARTGHDADAKLIRQICKDVELAAEDFLVFLPETDAQLWSGKGSTYLHARFAMWERLGHAKWSSHGRRQRLYRRCILPRRAQIDKVVADAGRAARGDDSGSLAA
jgi:hypothetical protein